MVARIAAEASAVSLAMIEVPTAVVALMGDEPPEPAFDRLFAFVTGAVARSVPRG